MAYEQRRPSSRRVFLVGCHRSGTTLVRYLLDAHPHLACPPETKFIAGLEAFFTYPQALYGLRSLGFSEERTLRALAEFTDMVLGAYAAAQGKPRWVDKTPNYCRLLPFIDRMFDGDVSYLLIARHPFDTIDSLERLPFSQGDPDVARARTVYGPGLAGWAKYWCEANDHLLAFAAEHEDRCLLFRYEDLVETPDRVVPRLCGFLDEPVPDNLVALAFQSRHSRGYQDWNIRTTTSIHRDSVCKWHDWPGETIAELWPIVADTAEKLGYSCAVERLAERAKITAAGD